MLRYLISALIFYWLFRFIINFIIPVFKATSQMKQQVREFQGKTGTNDSYRRQERDTVQRKKPAREDYIDFEEVR